jgi:predicted DNA binding protein
MTTESRHGTPPVTEVEFSATGAEYPFVTVSDREDCTVELAELVPRGDGRYAEFFAVTGTAPGDLLEAVDEATPACGSVLREDDGGGLVVFVVSDGCPAVDLGRLGALPRDVRAVDGTGHVTAQVPEEYDPATVVAEFLDDHPEFELVAKRGLDAVTPLFSTAAFTDAVDEVLTDRQREVLAAAFRAGYYEWPRETTGAAVADELGIASATFSEHVHAAERKVMTVLFERSRGETQQS